jgi:hypothetical protein
VRGAVRTTPNAAASGPLRVAPIAAAILAALMLAAPAWAVTITGRVVKGPEHAPVKDVPVSMHIVRGNEELPGTTVNSDASGGFQFNGLTAGAGIEYYLSTEYQGAFYTEGPVAVQGGAATQDMTVYDVGKNFGAVKVQDHHVIVERQSDGLHVTEIIIFQNDANTAYLGVGLNHAMESGMRVGLPSSVKDFQPGLGLDEPSVHLQGRELMSMRPIPPGQRPLSFTYVVPLSGRMDLSHRLYFPTRQITVLLSDPKLHLDSNQLVSDGTRQQGGKSYAMYVGHDLPVGAEVEAKVGGAGFFSNPKVYPFMAAPFVILAVLWIAARRGSRQLKAKQASAGAAAAGAHAGAAKGNSPGGSGAPRPVAASATAGGAGRAAPSATPLTAAAKARLGAHAGGNGDDDMAHTYLYLITALDQGVERGDITEESHALVRNNLKRRLEMILADAPQAKSR